MTAYLFPDYAKLSNSAILRLQQDCKGHSEDTELGKTFRNVSHVLQGYEHTKGGLYKGLHILMNKFSLV